jgi:membrane protease YdiL (CAAX protease family)
MNDLPPVLAGQPEPLRPIKLRRTGVVLAIIAIGVCVWLVLISNSQKASGPGAGSNTMGDLRVRYIIGMQRMMQMTKEAPDLEVILSAESAADKSPAERFRTEILRSVFKNEWVGQSPRIEALVKGDPGLTKDLRSIQELESKGAAMDVAEWERLRKRHLSAARLVRAQATEWKEDDWQKLEADSMRTMGLLAAASLGGICAVLGGIALLIFVASRWRRGLIVPRLRVVDPRFATTMLEAFAIYFFPFVVGMSVLQRMFPQLPGRVFYAVALVFVVLAVYWPRLRGMKRDDWRETVGLHCGAGVFKEIGIGVVGWVAGLPLVVVGALLGAVISSKTGLDATHPIVDSLREPGMQRWLMVALASVWAPVVEELMFRGLLFPSLSAPSRWIFGSVLSAFIFALIHPQGWAGIPPLMGLALTMNALRQFRGSIIAPMAAHALNNGLVTILMIYVL